MTQIGSVLLAMVLVASGGHAAIGAGAGALTVAHLRWDGRDNPLGFIQFEPRLSWIVSSRQRGQHQTAYRVLVATAPEKLTPGQADVWDSQKVASPESLNISYRGPQPHARQRRFWTVQVWDADDRPSAFAAPAWWEMGLYDEEWAGQWIGRRSDADARAEAGEVYAREVHAREVYDRSVSYLRKSFAVAQPVVRARLYASGFGTHELSINGRPAAADVLAPGYTDYEKRVLFQAYDVTGLVHRGDNVIGAVVAGGWCTAALGGRAGACGVEPPRVMLQLELTLGDGSLQKVITDQSWRVHAGPIVSAHLTDGEDYDARREMPGWDTPGFDDRAWALAQQYDKKKERDLVADPGPPIQVTQDLKPVRITEPRAGTFVFDLGQDIVGWARLQTRAAAGRTITLRYGEALNPDGSLFRDNLGGARATDRYTAKGAGKAERWEPRFSVHGFRYVEVTGLDARPAANAITGRVVHSLMAPTGQLVTSNPTINRLVANIDWSQRGAFLSVPTTGPQGATRLGSMLEARAFALTACLNRDVQTFYRKWIDDIRDAQRPNAAYADAAPLAQAHEGGPGAGTAGVLVPWALDRCYDDRTALDAHLASMGRWLESVRAANPDLVWRNQLGVNLGDPLELGPGTDKALIATAELAHAADVLARMARHAGHSVEPEARGYDALAKGARTAFARTFTTAEGKLTGDTQTGYALAIGLGVLDGEERAQAGNHLVRAVERQGKHLTTGILGTAYLLPALSAIGRDDLAYDLLLQPTCPSFACSIDKGATTIWQRWDGGRAGDKAGAPESGSLNHYALGAVGEWMYDAIGGIALDGDAPAGRHVFIRPRPGGGLTFARARYESRYGPIGTEWHLGRGPGATFRLKVEIPANSRATVTLPFATAAAGRATEGGRPLEQAAGVKVLRAGPAGLDVAITSGSYDFTVLLP
jgi:alpha-L-rhamnosidase